MLLHVYLCFNSINWGFLFLYRCILSDDDDQMGSKYGFSVSFFLLLLFFLKMEKEFKLILYASFHPSLYIAFDGVK